ncbi:MULTISPECIES: GNAT family N-acetyltransferase [Sinorhizobium]|uniref:GCN5-related N-acetyltransferase protein n=1 Tax=Rhizobium fredii TaxID=380 RepID=A0A2L0HGM8_RHIFR|nr:MULTISPECIES: GNAT family N-acetyltransferase [Sinorhizobium]AUX80623.1 GCN5-related N-acetyltransferase protein [Sinorhizobium fredii]PDT51389.1 GNAT family N-acetyltransferase [Sinorhizobium sp. NG07B]POH26039.1 GNAT family N-acetyltransferase [Sinorhizobium americanum]
MSPQIKTNARDDAFAVRRTVFIEEQGYENEFDGIDDHPSCVHVTLYIHGELAGCSRLFPELVQRALAPESPQSPPCTFDEGVTAGETYLLGRVAVMPAFRRRGLASVIIAASDEAAREAGAKLVKLHAQEYAHDLYAKQGYTQISDVDYEDEGQPHLWMAKRL